MRSPKEKTSDLSYAFISLKGIFLLLLYYYFTSFLISSLNLMVFQFLYNLLSVLLWNYYFYLIETKLLKESNKYGSYNTCTSGSTLSRVALNFPLSREQMEKECMRLVKPLGILVFCYSFVAINEIILF